MPGTRINRADIRAARSYEALVALALAHGRGQRAAEAFARCTLRGREERMEALRKGVTAVGRRAIRRAARAAR